MAQLVLATAGAWLGSVAFPSGILGVSGGAFGWFVGSTLGSAFGPKQKSFGPRIDDLKVTGTGYGQPVPWVAGSPRVGGTIIWSSKKRETATTTEVGKGGGSEYTEYTYDCDVLYMLSENEISNVSRIWSNGKLVYDGAKIKSGFCDSISVYTGADDQLPDPIYEAAVGVGNAPAYRSRGTVMIGGLKLGNSGFLPNLTFELGTSGIPEADYVYEYTGTEQTLVVPSGVTKLFVKMWGGGGCGGRYRNSSGYRFDSFGGGGGYVRGEISVTPGETLRIIVGGGAQHGVDSPFGPFAYRQSAGTPGWGGASARFGGGLGAARNDSPAGGSGGAASAITRSDYSPLAVAGGGGGGGAYAALMEGGDTSLMDGAPGGGFDAAYLGKTGNADGYAFGGGGTQTRGGYAGNSPANQGGGNIGSLPGSGGSADIGDPPSRLFVGGGGGGGYYGGGGGSGSNSGDVGGGGGGSSYIPSGAYQEPGSGASAGGSSDPEYDGYGTGARGDANAGNGAIYIWSGGDPGKKLSQNLSNVVESLMERASFDSDEYDVSGLITTNEPQVRAIYLSQVAPTRSAIEILQSAYYFTVSKSDKIYFRFRDIYASGNFNYSDMGVSDSPEASDNPFQIKNTSVLEQPSQISLTYNNMSLDFNQDVASSDILVTDQKSTNAIQIPLGLLPSEAKGVVESMLLDQVAARVQYGPFRLPLSYAKYEPSDVVIIPDTEGDLHRVRLVKKTDMGVMLEFEGVGDDEGALIAAGIADDSDQGQTVVEQPSGSLWLPGDWPLFRDADDVPGYLALAKSEGDGDFWPGAGFFRSWDDLTFSQVGSFAASSIFGKCSTILPDFTGGNVWDESSVLRVDVGQGELSSSTKSAMQADLSINVAMVGAECIRFRLATLISTGVYDLSGLIRGFRGTEWAIGIHSSDEDFALVNFNTNWISVNTNQIGLNQFVKAVTFNTPLSSEDATQFNYTGVNLKPFSVSNPRALYTEDGLLISWNRRTRRSYSYGGVAGVVSPLGEAFERYRLYFYDGSTLIRTEVVNDAQEFLYTEEMAQEDGLSSNASVTIEIVQVSEIVGDGYPSYVEGMMQ